MTGTVEADETYIGKKPGMVKAPKGVGFRHKLRVVSLVSRDTGEARSFNANSAEPNEVANIVRANVSKEAALMTDEARHYWAVGREFADHQRVMHSVGEYVRGETLTHSLQARLGIGSIIAPRRQEQ